MTVEQIDKLAADFWERAGVIDPPGDLERALTFTCPVFVVRLSGLCLGSLRGWLRRRNQSLALTVPDRPLQGCLVAHRGRAAVFLEDELPADEQRGVLAHECGHYLAHYEEPRRRAVARFGPTLLPVLDGLRPPSDAELLATATVGLSLRPHVHYLDRSFDPVRQAGTRRVEQTADDLACELLAPRRVLLARIRAERWGPDDPRPCETLLQEHYRFPPRWACAYSRRLLAMTRRHRTFTDILGLGAAEREEP
jgi:hypothetical protein